MAAAKPDIRELVRDMGRVRDTLDVLPENQEWTETELESLEEMRHLALQLVAAAEAILEDK